MSAFSLLRHSDRQELKLVPGALEILLLARKRFRHRLATASTSVCIEAFPRSGTGYTVALALYGLHVPRKAIASNTHSLANIRRAVSRHIPTFVPIREPLPSCLSLMVWGVSSDLLDLFRTYHQFYSGLLPIIDRVTIVPFEVLIDSPDRVFDRLALSVHKDASWSDELASAVTHEHITGDLALHIGAGLRSGRPNAAKEQMKDALLDRHFTAEAKQWHARCERLRDHLMSVAPNKVETPQRALEASNANCRGC